MSTDKIDNIIGQLSKNQQSLDSVLELVGNFVSTYESIRGSIDKLNIPVDYNFAEDISAINKNLENINKTFKANKAESEEIKSSFAEIENQISNLDEYLKQIGAKYQSILDQQNAVSNFVKSLDSLSATIDKLNFDRHEKKINEYCKKVDQLSKGVKDELMPMLVSNNATLDDLKKTVCGLLEDKNKQQKAIDIIASEFVSISKSLEKISQKDSVDKAVVFALFDEWQESKRKSKKK